MQVLNLKGTYLERIQVKILPQSQFMEEMQKSLQRRFWRRDIAFLLVLGNILGLYLAETSLLGLGTFFLRKDLFGLLTLFSTYLYWWIWYLEGDKSTKAIDWPGAISGGLFLGFMVALLQLLTESISDIISNMPHRFANTDYILLSRMIIPKVWDILGHFSTETLIAFFVSYVGGVLLVLLLPRKFCTISFGLIIISCYLWVRKDFGNVAIGGDLSFSRGLSEHYLRHQVKMLNIWSGIGMALLLYGGMTALNWTRHLNIAPEKQELSSKLLQTINNKQVQTRFGKYKDICRPVIWGWLIASVLTYNIAIILFVPLIFAGMFIPIFVAILVQAAIIHFMFIYERKSAVYRLVAVLAGVFLGFTLVLIHGIVFSGLSSQLHPSYLMDYTTTVYLRAAGLISGVFLGSLVLLLLRKNVALFAYGILMFIPAAITLSPPVMGEYLGAGSFVGLKYFHVQSILYFPMGISMGCLMVAIRNMLRTYKITRDCKLNIDTLQRTGENF